MLWDTWFPEGDWAIELDIPRWYKRYLDDLSEKCGPIDEDARVVVTRNQALEVLSECDSCP